jgi:hypothetical protein
MNLLDAKSPDKGWMHTGCPMMPIDTSLGPH